MSDAGYWEDPKAWRYFGDIENNWGGIGNQQSSAEKALVEKIINSIDARLINECLVNNIDPEGENAPQSIKKAVAKFFGEGTNKESIYGGQIEEWDNQKKTKIAKGITLYATGKLPRQGNPCLVISDCGEGQTPDKLPETFLSLNKSNKLNIPFVQGVFNMGGTGVLRFCGENKLQLVLSRRNPKILPKANGNVTDSNWGFTIVRQESERGKARNSIFKYLAPVANQDNPTHGNVLSFKADSMPIFPDKQAPYKRESKWGSLVKLYEYQLEGTKSNIIWGKSCLRDRLESSLTKVALPIRVHECRSGFKGHEGSFDTNLMGMEVRLASGKGENIEPFFPDSQSINVNGEKMTATIYVFKENKDQAYRKNEGIIFTINGQSHGYLTKDFFGRTKFGLGYIKKSILMTIDCSEFSVKARETLFKSSRDQLMKNKFRNDVEAELEELLKHHKGLKELQDKRRSEKMADDFEESKSLEDILNIVLKSSPTLSSLFLPGQRLTNPVKPKGVRSNEVPYEGKKFPTFFKFKNKDYGYSLSKDCHINMRCRITFETDVENDFFDRKNEDERGEFDLKLLNDEGFTGMTNTLNLHNGIATLSIQLPDQVKIGDSLDYTAQVDYPDNLDPYINKFNIVVQDEADSDSKKRKRRKPPGNKKGDDREIPSGIALPPMKEIYEKDWGDDYDKFTALKLVQSGKSNENDPDGDNKGYDFFINMDNIYLKTEMKHSADEEIILKTRFKVGLVLLGLSLLHNEKEIAKALDSDVDENADMKDLPIEKIVGKVCDSTAMVLLPLIISLGSTAELEKACDAGGIGEDT